MRKIKDRQVNWGEKGGKMKIERNSKKTEKYIREESMRTTKFFRRN